MKVCRKCQLKSLPRLRKFHSIRLDLIEKVFEHACIKETSNLCEEAFILSLQFKRKCRMEADIYSRFRRKILHQIVYVLFVSFYVGFVKIFL